jgi:hypothetical protein
MTGSCVLHLSGTLQQSVIEDLHAQANSSQSNFYHDPFINKLVLTSYYLSNRGHCCGSGCRHCPYQGDLLGDNSGI